MKNHRIAVLSDIHGNSWALEAVLKDIRSRGIERIVNLGDSLYGPLDPYGTMELIAESRMISISGNEDRLIIDSIGKTTEVRTLQYVLGELNLHAIEWLSTLTSTRILDGQIFMCHGTPACDDDYFLEHVNNGCVQIRDTNDLEDILGVVRQKVILCGHSHIPRIVTTNRHMIINPGSVGLPAFTDEKPVMHKMEKYNPDASYTILSSDDHEISVDQVSINYDFEKAARYAESNNRQDWARWLRTGRA